MSITLSHNARSWFPTLRHRVADCERAFSLLEIIVGLLMIMTLFGSTASMFLTTTKKSRDHQVMSRTDELARSVLDMMAYDIRMAGAGMPIGQSQFDPTDDADLGDAPLAVLLTATDSQITIRLNEKGAHTVLTAEFTPGMFDTDFDVLSTDGFEVGDMIYLSDMYVAGNDGLKGEITSISGNTITIDGGYTTSAGAIFPVASTVHKVREVTYESPDDPDIMGITRDDGTTNIEITPGSSFSLEYLDNDGTALALPLSELVVRDSLAAIRITVTVESTEPIDDQFYTSEVEQLVSLRNLVVNH